MISRSQNRALLMVAEKSSANTLWGDYGEYCRLREKGLRKQSFDKLNKFIGDFKLFNLDQKKEFTVFIYELAETVENADYGPLPHQISTELKKSLLTWTETEAHDSRPFRWLAKFFYEYDYAKKALEINPQDDLARVFLISKFVNDIRFSTHHLPAYYIGDPETDIQYGALARRHIDKLIDDEEKIHWKQGLESELMLVESYADWKSSGSDSEFRHWAQENQRIFSSGIDAYYYEP